MPGSDLLAGGGSLPGSARFVPVIFLTDEERRARAAGEDDPPEVFNDTSPSGIGPQIVVSAESDAQTWKSLRDPDADPGAHVREAIAAVRAGAPLDAPPSPNREPYPYAGTISVGGIRIAVEVRAGDRRYWYDAAGQAKGSTLMLAHYGEIPGTLGLDGDPIDVFVGPAPDAPRAWIVHQTNPRTGAADEDKLIVGYPTKLAALAMYLQSYDSPAFFGGVTECSVDDLRAWLDERGSHGEAIAPVAGAGAMRARAPAVVV